MKYSRDIQSLSVFKRDTAKFLNQMKETGEPIVLTVNGKPAAVVVEPEAYDFWQERDRRETIEAIRRGREDVEAGRVRNAEEFFDEMFAKYDIPWNE